MDKLRTHEDCDQAPRPIVALATEHLNGEHIPAHRHARAQLIHTVSGVMTVNGGEEGRSESWIVPPGRAVWMPAHQPHSIRIAGRVSMRTVFVRKDALLDLPPSCEVIEVSPFLREVIVAATRIPLDYAVGGRDERVMQLILDEILAAPRLDLHIGLPRSPRLRRACERVIADPALPITLEGMSAQLHVSGRTLARMFHREVGMSFGEWLRRTRLLLSLPRLAAGSSVLEVALEHGYESPSAYAAMFRRTLKLSPTAYVTARSK